MKPRLDEIFLVCVFKIIFSHFLLWFLSCQFIQGKLFGTVHSDDSVWTIEDGCLLTIVMSKANYEKKEEIWEALLHDGHYQPDPPTLHEMRKKIDLEKFQLEVIYFECNQLITRLYSIECTLIPGFNLLFVFRNLIYYF